MVVKDTNLKKIALYYPRHSKLASQALSVSRSKLLIRIGCFYEDWNELIYHVLNKPIK